MSASTSQATVSSSEDLNAVFRKMDLGVLHKSKAALEDFHKRDPLPICGICTKTPEKCTRDSKGSYRCTACIKRKEACSWKSDIAVIEIVRLNPRVDPVQARMRYNRWVEDSRLSRNASGEKRQRPVDEAGDETSTKRKRRRAPYRSWATEESPVPSQRSPTPEAAPSGSPFPQNRIMTLDDLNAFNYATLKKEKEAAEESRNHMAQSLDAALRKINNLEAAARQSEEDVRILREENRRLKEQL